MILFNWFSAIQQGWSTIANWWWDDRGFFMYNSLPLIIAATLSVFGAWAWHYRKPLVQKGFTGYVDLESVPLPITLFVWESLTLIGMCFWPFLLWVVLFGSVLLGPFLLVYHCIMFFARRQAQVEAIVARLEG